MHDTDSRRDPPHLSAASETTIPFVEVTPAGLVYESSTGAAIGTHAGGFPSAPWPRTANLPLPPLLDVGMVQARYGVSARGARTLIHDAGGFSVGGRLVVRADDLERHERSQRSGRDRATVKPGVSSDNGGVGRPASLPTDPWDL